MRNTKSDFEYKLLKILTLYDKPYRIQRSKGLKWF
jgi:hypothetical protein